MNRRVLACLLAAAGLAACKESRPAESHATAPAPAPAPAAPAQPESASVASVPGRSDPECVGPVELGVPSEVKLKGRTAKVDGYKLAFDPPLAKGGITLGVIANTKEATGDNLVNLSKYVAWFKEQKVEAVVVDGDTAQHAQGFEKLLAPLAALEVPVFVIIGNGESKADYVDGVSAARKAHPNVFDLDKIREADLGAATLVSLPGYHDPRFLHSDTGCQYHSEDAAAVAKLAAEAKSPVVLVSHGPPRGATRTAVDFAGEAGNVGDPNINKAMEAAKIPFGIFANIHEAGAKATADLAGAATVAQNTQSDTLYLNPGPADDTRWVLNDGSELRGAVAVMRVKGRQASYEIFRAPALTEAELAKARGLEAGGSAGGRAEGEGAKHPAAAKVEPASIKE